MLGANTASNPAWHRRADNLRQSDRRALRIHKGKPTAADLRYLLLAAERLDQHHGSSSGMTWQDKSVHQLQQMQQMMKNMQTEMAKLTKAGASGNGNSSKGDGKGSQSKSKGGGKGNSAKGSGKGEPTVRQPIPKTGKNWDKHDPLYACQVCKKEICCPTYDISRGCRDKACEGLLCLTAIGRKQKLPEPGLKPEPAPKSPQPSAAATAKSQAEGSLSGGPEEKPPESNDCQLVVPPGTTLIKGLRHLVTYCKANEIQVPVGMPDLGRPIEPTTATTEADSKAKAAEIKQLQDAIASLTGLAAMADPLAKAQERLTILQKTEEQVQVAPFDAHLQSGLKSELQRFRATRLRALSEKATVIEDQIADLQAQMDEIATKEEMVKDLADRYLVTLAAVEAQTADTSVPVPMQPAANISTGCKAKPSQTVATATSTHLASIAANPQPLLAAFVLKEPEMGKLAEAVPQHLLSALLQFGGASASSLAVNELNNLEMQEQPTVTTEPPAEEATVLPGSSKVAAMPAETDVGMAAKESGGEVRTCAEDNGPKAKLQKTTVQA